MPIYNTLELSWPDYNLKLYGEYIEYDDRVELNAILSDGYNIVLYKTWIGKKFAYSSANFDPSEMSDEVDPRLERIADKLRYAGPAYVRNRLATLASLGKTVSLPRL